MFMVDARKVGRPEGRLHPRNGPKEVTDGGRGATGTVESRPLRRKKETDAAAKPVAKRTTVATARPRKKAVAGGAPPDVATLAYLLWEQAEPGDATDHWLRAERELEAA
jgi:hypothetical protein